MKFSYILVFFALTTSNLCAQDWRTLYTTANVAYNEGDIEVALSTINKCLEIYPPEDQENIENYSALLRLKANIEFYQGNYSSGLESSEKEIAVRAAKKDLKYAGALENTAEFQLARGKYKEALQLFESAGQVLSQFHQNTDRALLINQLNQAVCLYFINAADQAELLFDSSFSVLGTEVTDNNMLLRGHYNYALICYDREEPEKALEHLTWCKKFYELVELQQTQEYHDVLYNMAYAEAKVSNFELAEQLFLSAQSFYEEYGLTKQENYSQIINGRIQNLQRQGKASKAMEIISAATSADNLHPSLLANKAAFLQSTGKVEEAEKLYRQVLMLSANNKESVLYAETQQNLAILLSEGGSHDEALHLMKRSLEFMQTSQTRGSKKYLSASINFGNVLLNAGKSAEAANQFQETLGMCKSTTQVEWAKALNGLAICQLRQGKLVKADSSIQQIFEKADMATLKTDLLYSSILNNMATIKQAEGQLTSARELTRQAANHTLMQAGVNNIHYLTSLENLAFMDLHIGDMQNAKIEIDSVLLLTRQLRGDQSDNYASALITMGKFYQYQGEFAKAEPYFKNALDIVKNNKGTADHIRALNALGIFYQIMGNYEQAEPLFNSTINLIENQNGKQHPEYATSIQNLATLYQFQGKFADAEKLLNIALEIDKSVYGELHPQFAISLQNLATVYIQMGQYIKAQPLLERVLQIGERTIGKYHPSYAVSLSNLASLYQDTRQPEKAEAAWKESVAIRKQILGEDHPDYARSLYGLAGIYFAKGELEKAKTIYEVVIEKYLKQIHDNFPSMSEKEKGAFYAKIKPVIDTYLDFCVEYYYRNQKSETAMLMLGKLYDIQLATKAILLNSTNKVRELILTSNDKSLVKDFQHWIQKKEFIIQYYSLSLEEREAQGVDVKILEEEANALEKVLSSRSELFKTQFDKQPITHKDVIKALQPGEAAIEIIRLKKKLHKDSVSYIGLVVTKESPLPHLVVWSMGNLLEGRYYRYFRNAIRYQFPDTISFNNFWRPLQAALANKSKIFVSSDGIFNKINLATIRDPYKNEYVIDNYTLSQISNSSEIVSNKMQPKEQPNSDAVLIGAVDFNMKGSKTSQGEKRTLLGTYGFRGDLIPELPATGQEVDQISSILNGKQWTPVVLKEEKATETRLKQIHNPRVLHVATHGFFLSDVELSESESQQEIFSNPLLRSGILLAGAGIQVEDSNMISSDDGTLTAYEAMNLYLDQTELVVLSACETGLGEIRNGEGVYGLQRSFIVAGSKAVMMSLWQVDDVATQELMVEFYINWLNGKNKLEAFRQAQLTMKNKYKDPYYWGAFVMIGG